MSRIENLPITALRESPFNPRKAFDPAALQELASSIASQGVLQPVVVRPLYPNGDAPTHARERYEVVFGHRRTRAAALADLEYVPCIVREMSDQEAAIAQVHENVQRADVTALEEADSFRHLMDEHGMSADTIAAAVGKSRSYVYGRLKLGAAAPAVREAIATQGLSPDIGLEVARLRSHKLQQDALRSLRLSGDGWVSVREAKRLLRGRFPFTLSIAEWDPADKAMPGGACSTCPKLAANDPDLAELGADVCTDNDCFTTKNQTHADQQTAELRRMGHTVITGAEAETAMPYGSASYLRGFYAASQIDADDQAVLSGLREAGADLPEPVYLRNPHTHALIKAYRDADYTAVCTAIERHRKATEGASTPTTAARAPAGRAYDDEDDARDRVAHTADWTPAERAFTDPDASEAIVTAVLAALTQRDRTADDLRVILMREYDLAGELDSRTSRLMGLDPDHAERKEVQDERAWWEDRLARMTGAELGQLLLGMALEEHLGMVSPYGGLRTAAARRVALARHYGVEPAQIAAQAAAKGQEQTDDAGAAGERDANTSDMFEEATA